MRIFLIVALALLAASCETMSPQACQSADWRALGEVDGAAGAALSKYEARQNDCAKAGITADFASYSVGRDYGLQTFCQPASGFRAGLNGYAYAGVCPGAMEADFMSGYRDGARAYAARQELSSAESAVSSARSERDRLQDKIKAFEETLRRPSATDAEKAEARKRIGEVQDDLRRARDRIRDAESDRDRAGYALDRVRFDIGSRWGSW
ncbi:MAG TPA: DUF2799 domain-containing protein [Caulobacterales bacterium]|nr:DUF2799 domain-containing protein [Caulobacterales bacterium]